MNAAQDSTEQETDPPGFSCVQEETPACPQGTPGSQIASFHLPPAFPAGGSAQPSPSGLRAFRIINWLAIFILLSRLSVLRSSL